MIGRHKGRLVLIGLLGLVAGVAVGLIQVPVYRSRALLEIQDSTNQISRTADSGGPGTAADIQTQVAILQSATLIKRVAAKLQVNPPSILAAETDHSPARSRALNPPGVTAREDALQMAQNHVKARAVGQTRIIEVLVDSTDPTVASTFANALTAQFIEQNMEARLETTHHAGQWLQRQHEDMRVNLERSEKALQRYARRAGLITAGGETNLSEEKLRQLQAALSAAQAERVEKQSRFEMAQVAQPQALPDVLNDATLRQYQTNLTDLRRQRAELSTTLTPEHAKVRRVDAQISTLESALENQRTAIVVRLRNEYQEAQRREKLLAAAYENQTQVVTDQAGNGVQYNLLRRKVDSNRQLYASMLQRVQQAKVASALRGSNVCVVDEAEIPTAPYKPKISLNAALGLLAGLFVGIGFVLVRELVDPTVQSSGDLGLYLNLPKLGVIPSVTTASHIWFASGKRRKLIGPSCLTGNDTSAAAERVELVTWQNKPSGVADSFRSVLTSILFASRTGTRRRVLVLTSPGPGEGKTTVASNLGIALAELGQIVLLIDADLRKPRLHQIFDLSNACGLSGLLQEDLLSRLATMLQETHVAGLFVLPAGPVPAAATSLLYSTNFVDLVNRLGAEFDTILIDTPPMLQMPDARVIGRLADSVILVIRAGQTTRDSAQAVCQRLADDGTPVMGLVLNGFDPKLAYAGCYKHFAG
jgi:capsular exopolysaccharide synthesis family protein